MGLCSSEMFSCLISDKCSHLCTALFRDGTVLPKSCLQCIRTPNKVSDLLSLSPSGNLLQMRYSIAVCTCMGVCKVHELMSNNEYWRTNLSFSKLLSALFLNKSCQVVLILLSSKTFNFMCKLNIQHKNWTSWF